MGLLAHSQLQPLWRLAAMQGRAHFAGQRMFGLRIEPNGQWFGGLVMQPPHQNFAQALVVAKEVGPIAKAVAAQERGVILFRTVLDVQHGSANILLRQPLRLYANQQDIEVLRQKLP